MTTVTILLLPLLAFVVQNSEALHCWECNSDNDYSCSDPFDTSSNKRVSKDCDPYKSGLSRGHYACRKYVKIVGDEKKRVVDRSCVVVSDQDHDQGPCSSHNLSNPSHVESCHVCDSNECNSAPGLALVSFFTLLPTALLSLKQL